MSNAQKLEEVISAAKYLETKTRIERRDVIEDAVDIIVNDEFAESDFVYMDEIAEMISAPIEPLIDAIVRRVKAIFSAQKITVAYDPCTAMLYRV